MTRLCLSPAGHTQLNHLTSQLANVQLGATHASELMEGEQLEKRELQEQVAELTVSSSLPLSLPHSLPLSLPPSLPPSLLHSLPPLPPSLSPSLPHSLPPSLPPSLPLFLPLSIPPSLLPSFTPSLPPSPFPPSLSPFTLTSTHSPPSLQSHESVLAHEKEQLQLQMAEMSILARIKQEGQQGDECKPRGALACGGQA